LAVVRPCSAVAKNKPGRRLRPMKSFVLRKALAGDLALCFGYSIEFGGRAAFVDEFFILPEARGRGLGGRLLEEVKAAAAAEGILALHLDVARQNEAAQRIYTRHGFQSRALRFGVHQVDLIPPE